MHLDAAIQTNAVVEATSLLVDGTAGGKIQNPALRIRRQELQQARACCAALGFDPSSRSRIEIEPEVGDGDDDWSDVSG
jgi:P27 family predicted phage terminase small subunit